MPGPAGAPGTTPPTSTSELSILKSLNKAQRQAVTSKAPIVAILAGPGSGKTHTLISRVVWLIQNVGFQPADVIVATFTVKAAREMKERIGKSLGHDCEKKIVLGTFHSIARRYLAVYGSRIGLDPKFGIADDGDSKAIIQRICKRLDLNIEPPVARAWISKRKAKGSAAPVTEGRKQADHPALLQCFQEYQEHLERANLLDYDDLLVKCVELLQDHPSCVANVQAVLIDEYQDTNGIQYELMRLFAQARHRITVVGDPDQSIYGWRSAEIKNLYRLLREYPNTHEISLEENYRSSQAILSVSLSVIQQDKKRYPKVLLPVHDKGARPVLRKLKSAAAEGEWIVTEAKRVVMMLGKMLKYQDVAILLRSAALSRHVEAALGKAGMQYRMIGGRKFYERKEIKVLMDYLRVIHQPNNNDAVARILNVPRRGIGETTIKALLEEAEKAKMSLWSLLCKHCRGDRTAKTNIRSNMEQKLNVGFLRIINNLQGKAKQITDSSQFTIIELIELLTDQLGFKKYLEDEYAEDHEQRWANVQEFVNLAGDFMRDPKKLDEEALPEIEDLEQAKEDSLLGRFLANVALASDAQRGDTDQDTSAMLTISTIHAAKGLEWPVVFVPSVYAGSIPHSRAEDIDEERRLLYVAMTRAQALLYLSCPLYGSQGMGNSVELSPFISSLPTSTFDKQGPTLNRPIIESAARILDREPPSEQQIFGHLPPMFSVEDDRFPVDPADPKHKSDGDGQRAPKRQRSDFAAAGDGKGTAEKWQREYATTMEMAHEFTVNSLPSFVTASAHHTTLAGAAAAIPAKAAPAKRTANGGSTRRPADQRSLLGFVSKRTASAPREDTNTLPPFPRGLPPGLPRTLSSTSAHRDASPAIAPELTKHKLGASKHLSKRPASATSTGGSYACFSSSPTRPTCPDTAKQPEPEPVSRPMTTFHSTTWEQATNKTGPRRPVGLGPPPTMERLRRPFKPLTMNRPRPPGG